MKSANKSLHCSSQGVEENGNSPTLGISKMIWVLLDWPVATGTVSLVLNFEFVGTPFWNCFGLSQDQVYK